jgi:hypothetical protein
VSVKTPAVFTAAEFRQYVPVYGLAAATLFQPSERAEARLQMRGARTASFPTSAVNTKSFLLILTCTARLRTMRGHLASMTHMSTAGGAEFKIRSEQSAFATMNIVADARVQNRAEAAVFGTRERY